MTARNYSSSRRVRRTALVASAAMMVPFVTAGPAFARPAYRSDASRNPASASVADNTLTITGTNGPDTIALAADAADPNALIVDFGNGNTQRFDRTTFNAISVALRDGDDQFTEPAGVFADEFLTVDGGDGNDHITTGDGNDVIFGGRGDDTIFSGKGDDTVFGGQGNDFVDGGFGHDTAFLNGGDDSFQWDPGDGSDVVDGGQGRDTLVFNGSSGNEVMSLSANGDRSVFLRDLGNIRMDMNDVEQLHLAPLGGSDKVTINDMSGTGFREADVDLSVAGADDNAADVVTVNGTDQSDHVRVDSRDSQVNVEGLATDTHITGSGTGDQLQVNTLDGNDRVDVGHDVTSIIGVQTDLGAGQH